MSKKLLIALLAIIAGFVLLFPVGMVFEYLNWPLFHSWGIWHGALILAWPILTAVSFGTIKTLGNFIHARRASRLL